MSVFKLAKFRELFDKNNSISEDIVAMAVLITEGVVLTISCICLCFFGGIFNRQGIFNEFHTSAIILGAMGLLNSVIALFFKAHEAGDLDKTLQGTATIVGKVVKK